MAGPAWWTVDGGGAVLAGPFPSRAAAATAEPPPGQDWSEVDALVPVFGNRLAGGGIEVCSSPAGRAFEAYLSEQLARLPGGVAAGCAGR